MEQPAGKTIKQIADELGVSKQTVYKRYKGKLYRICAPFVFSVDGMMYISDPGEALIKQDFNRSNDRSSAPIGAHTTPHTEHPDWSTSEANKNGASPKSNRSNDRSSAPIGAHTVPHTEHPDWSTSEANSDPVFEVLKEQLAIKDSLIEQQQRTIQDLTSALVSTQESLKAAQALHAGTIQAQLSDSSNSGKRDGFFSRIFGGGKKSSGASENIDVD